MIDNEISMRLNKYLAHAGIGDRRTCDQFIMQGLVRINQMVVKEPGTKVTLTDEVKFRENIVRPEKKIYILLNKPKNIIFEEPAAALDVLGLIHSFPAKMQIEYKPIVHSIDEMERTDLGLMLITSDEELLLLYKSETQKINGLYQLLLDKPMTEDKYEQLKKGIKVNNKLCIPESIDIDTEDAHQIGIQLKILAPKTLHNLFQQIGYTILKLDRTMLFSLTKRDLPRGKWRFLTPNEIVKLKYLRY